MKVIGFGSGVETAPGVYTTEQDQTVTPAAGASTEAAIAGLFSWGPVNFPTLLGSEPQLASVFGNPSNFNAETWFSGANYLAYANKLWVNRVGNTAGELFSAVVNTATMNTSLSALHTVENKGVFENAALSFTTAVDFIAKYPGSFGNSLRLSICASPSAYQSTANLASGTFGANVAFTVGSNTATLNMTANTTKVAVEAVVVPGDIVVAGNTVTGLQEMKVVSVTPTAGTTAVINFDRPFRLSENVSATVLTRKWEFAGLVSSAPGTSFWGAKNGNVAAADSLHMVVVDQGGVFTGRAGAVLEVFEGLSRATDALNTEGASSYYQTYINQFSDFVYAGTSPTGLTSNTAVNIATLATLVPTNSLFSNGADGNNETNVNLAVLLKGYDTFANKDSFSLSAIITGQSRGGASGEQKLNYIIDNIAEARKNVVVYGSVPKAAVVGNRGGELIAATAFRGNVRNTSYGFLDSGYKYQYDKYNDQFRWIPLCGDIAGLSARTDVTNDPWFAPAGFNRGLIKNLVRLAWNPTPAEQKIAFAADINNVVTIANDGTYLLGDKTLYGQQSALNQLGTRKMLNILKTSLARAARTLLFEFNDEFTQARFKNITEPYLRDIQGRRGLKNFKVVADGSNNTDAVVNGNRFVGDIYFVPARSIRTIQLNFVAIGSTADFQEIV